VVEAGKAAMDAGRTRYAPASGLPELRAAVARRYRQDFGVAFAPEEVTVAVGGKQGLALLYQAVLDRGTEVVVPVPAWPTFAEAARVAGARPVFVPLAAKAGFRVTARAVAKALTPRTRAVVVNSPSNPTGAVVEPGELLAIARLARKNGFWLVYDDTYARLVFRPGGLSALQEVKDESGGRLAVVGTASKAYCMTGWRVGWVIGPRPLAAACAALNSHSVQGPATVSQLAAVEALAGPQDVVHAMAAEYRARRNLVHPTFAAIPGVTCPQPDGGFYLFPDVSRCLSREVPDTVALASRLLEEKAVAVVPGEGFHAPGCFRLSLTASPEDLQEGARRIAAFLAEHAPPGGGRR
jgi:aspartate aminotransferase